MPEINHARQESQARLAEFDFTDQQCLCCPRCLGGEIDPVDACASWDVGRFWECTACHIVFEVRQIAREVGPAAAWL